MVSTKNGFRSFFSTITRHKLGALLLCTIAMSVILQLLLAFRLPLIWFGSTPGAGDEQSYVLQAYSLIFGKQAGGWSLELYNHIRSFFYPTILAGWLKLVLWVSQKGYVAPFFWSESAPQFVGGISQIGTGVFYTRLFNIMFSAFSIFLVYKLSSELYGNKKIAYISSLLLGSNWLFLFWGSRSLADPAMIPFFLLSLLFVTLSLNRSNRNGFYALLAGISLGFAFMIRFQSVILVLPVAIYYLIKYRKLLLYYVAGFAIILFFQGVLDYLTWGQFLESPVAWFRLTLGGVFNGAGSGGGSSYTFFTLSAPPYYLFTVLPLIFGPCLWLAFFGIKKNWQSFLPVSIVLTYMGLLSTGLQVFRYLLPIIPLICILMAKSYFYFNSKNKYMRYSGYFLMALSVIYGIWMIILLYLNPSHVSDMFLS
jgi:4-amino-4-deoxy-L-arabinose transferase-like glycosyltransferase